MPCFAVNVLCRKDSIIHAAFIFFLGAVAASTPVSAQAWNAFNVQYLYGSNYELEPEQVDILTLEWANGWAYGDNSVFVDITNFVQGDNTVYGEWAPRLSLSKITGKSFSAGSIQDVYLSATIELGEGISNYLIGGAIDLAMPGFNFFQINGYLRENSELSGSTWQATAVWNSDFEIGQTRWNFSGFIDWAGSEGRPGTFAYSKRNLHAQPQLLLDLGHLLDRPGRIYAGVEWLYWHNRYGIPGVTESVAQAMIKIIL